MGGSVGLDSDCSFMKSELSLYTILQILSLTLFEKTIFNQLLNFEENKTQLKMILDYCIYAIYDRTVVVLNILESNY